MRTLDPDKADDYEIEYLRCLKKKDRSERDQCIIDLWEALKVKEFHERNNEGFFWSNSDPV